MDNFNPLNLVVGLFGVCETTTWRKDVITQLENAGIDYFNPQLEPGQWTDAFVPIEAENLASDGVIVFVINEDSYGMGSLAEVGFGILNALKNSQDIVIYIAPTVNSALMEANPKLADASVRTRKLVMGHLKMFSNPRDFPEINVVTSLVDLINTTIKAVKDRKAAE